MEYISWLVSAFGVYRDLVPLLKSFASDHQVRDLCSGAGGPAIYLSQRIQPTGWVLSDLYPPDEVMLPEGMRYDPQALDVLKPQPMQGERYTMFNAFHHFSSAERAEIIRAYGKSGLMVVEILQPTVFDFVKIALATIMGQLLLAPFVRPFRWDRLFFTYVIPINLLTISWDGLVSVLKSIPFSRFKAEFEKGLPPGMKGQACQTGPFWARLTVGFALPTDD